MLAVMAEFERDLVSERTTVALGHKRDRGERVGKVPFGFTLAGDGINLVPNDQEQQIINLIGQLRDDFDDPVNYKGVWLQIVAAMTECCGRLFV